MQAGYQFVSPIKLDEAYKAIFDHIAKRAGVYGPENTTVFFIGGDGERMLPNFPSVSGVAYAVMDIIAHRDDLGHTDAMGKELTQPSPENYNVDGKLIILVDAVYKTGRSAKAAMSTLSGWGSPGSVDLAVLLRRNGSEMPIKPTLAVWDETSPGYERKQIPSKLVAKLTDDGANMVLRARE